MYEKLKQFGRVKSNEPMAKHTTFRIGGPADVFISVETTDKLVGLLTYLDGEGMPYIILGGGSNMLVRDEGFRGVAVKIDDKRYAIHDTVIEAAAGCVTADIAQKSIAAGLTGFEWGVGVPGTIGGAVRGNAGAMGGEMNDVVTEVEAYRDGEVVRLSNAECAFGYRDSVFKRGGGVVLRATLGLQKGETATSMRKALAHLKKRTDTQPHGQSIGCIFKNPDGKSAGQLIDLAGLKGASVGDAEVSAKHCNFILNKGNATAEEVLALIEKVKEKVYDTFGVHLEEEIQMI